MCYEPFFNKEEKVSIWKRIKCFFGFHEYELFYWRPLKENYCGMVFRYDVQEKRKYKKCKHCGVRRR